MKSRYSQLRTALARSPGICFWMQGLLALLLGPLLASAQFAYIANSSSNSVSVINTATNTVVTTIPVGAGPRRVAITPDGSRVYVTNSSSNSVSVIDTATNAVLATIPVANSPNWIAITPDGNRAYVILGFPPTTVSVSVIDTATSSVLDTVSIQGSSSGGGGLAITPDGKQVFVGSRLPDVALISVIDTATNTVVATHEEELGDGPPLSLAVTPNGTRLWAGTSDLGVGGFVVLDTANFAGVGSTFFSELRANQVAFTSDGSRAYVAEDDLNGGTIFLSVIDAVTLTTLAQIAGNSTGYGVAITPDGTRAYVVRNSGVFFGDVAVIDTTTNMVAATVAVGSTPLGIAITPCISLIGDVMASPNILWPPDHKIVNVSVDYSATDTCAINLTCTLSVSSNEPVSDPGAGHTSTDWRVVDDHHVLLRSERSGNGSGRIYSITVRCKNASGGSSTKTVTVSVPHNQ